MKSAAFEYIRPAGTAEAVAALVRAGDCAKPCGGTQSLGPMLNLRLAQVEQLVDLSRIETLQRFELRDDTLRIGSAVTHARIEDGALPDVTRGLLPSVASRIAYRAVRNRGTIGGSLAHADPAADWVSTMCLLDASLVLVGPSGERELAAREFFLGPFTTALEDAEIIAAVDVPRLSATARWAYRKICRKPGEFAEAIAALWTDPVLGIHRVLLGALGGMPRVFEDADLLAQLQRADSAAIATTRLLDAAGVEDDYEREMQAEMLRLAVSDLHRMRAPSE